MAAPLVSRSSARRPSAERTAAAPPLAATAAILFCSSAGPVGIGVQKLLVASFNPFLIIAVQMSVGAVTLWLVRLAIRHSAAPPPPPPPAAWAKGLLLGVLHPGAFMITFTAASARLDSITAVLVVALMPALVAVFGRVILKETLRPVVMIGILVSLMGLVILVSERQVTGENEPLGFVLGAMALVLAALGAVAGRAMYTGDGGATPLPWHLLAPLQVTGAAIVAWLGVGGLGIEVDVSAIASAWVPFAYLTFGMTAASYLAYNYALSELPMAKMGLLASAGPGVGAIAAAFLFDTSLGPVAVAGILIILLGAALPSVSAVLAPRRRAAQP